MHVIAIAMPRPSVRPEVYHPDDSRGQGLMRQQDVGMLQVYVSSCTMFNLQEYMIWITYGIYIINYSYLELCSCNIIELCIYLEAN